MAAQHQEIYTMNASLQLLVDIICKQEFATQHKISMKSENPTSTGVWFRFHHGMSFASYGEKITITLTPLAANSTQVTIHSECGMPTQLVDWGKNKQIVHNIFRSIEAFVCNSHMQQINSQPTPTQATPAQAAPTQPATAQHTRAFCHMCGAPVKPNANFCTSCGTKLN